jgi:alkanesulfonate monooxygenase SsuD/methylene tetrahydromethanopterin reductase-like flavin-dependent oxidoreductase (luciferase family)
VLHYQNATPGRGLRAHRVAYDSHEELIALAVAAVAPERIELMTTVLVAPPRQAVLLAKQATTLQAVSGGRFCLGFGIGGRDDDWLALGEEPKHRGQDHGHLAVPYHLVRDVEITAPRVSHSLHVMTRRRGRSTRPVHP